MAKGLQQNSRWRESAVQAALWLILGATIGAAALVTHRRQVALHVELGPAVRLGDISIRLPAGWAVARSAPRGMSEVLEATDRTNQESSRQDGGASSSGNGQRQIYVISQQLPAPMRTDKYLQYCGILPSADSPPIRGAPRILGPIEFGPSGGLLLDASLLVVQGNTRSVEKDIVACTILPWRQAVTIRLKGVGEPELLDEQIVREVAASLNSVVVQGAAISQLTLANGIRVGLPDGYKAIAESDALVSERQALLETSDGRWASLTLVPCILFPGEREQAIKTMLTARGLQWWIAGNTVHPRGAGAGASAAANASAGNEYEFGPLVETASSLVVRGYFKSSPNGQALMAFFHGATGELSSFEGAWEQLLSRTQFDPNFKTRDLLKAGATELGRVAKDEHVSIPTPGSSEWWIWRHAASDWNYGWSRTTYSDSRAASGVYESRHKAREDLQRATQITVNWETDFLNHTYQRGLERREMQAGREAQEAFMQSLRFEPGRFTSTVSSAMGAKPVQWDGAIPQQFIQGTFLPLLLGKISGPAMIIRTDWFADVEELPMLDPFTLILHPSGGGDGTTTRSAMATSKPVGATAVELHEMTIEVNGSGRMSRWYFKPDGSIAYIEFAGGFRREPADEHRIHEVFDQDAQLRPGP